MNKPPAKIDNARVILWAWSSSPFFVMKDTEGNVYDEVHGLAIARYCDSEKIYRFSCNSEWESIGDFDFEGIIEARTALSGNYDINMVNWIEFEI